MTAVFMRGGRPCQECHLWACKCGEQPVAECVTDEPEPVTTDAEFVAKTHRELARLSNEAAGVRRSIAHRVCADSGACVHCAKVRDLHRCIDDHLSQLEAALLEAAYEDAS